MDLRTELVKYYRWLRQYGLNDSHSGNASVRDGHRIWVTPSGCCADTLEPEDLVLCTIDGHLGEGASLDAALHLAVYRATPKAHAILHSHGPHTVAITLNGNNFVPVDFEGGFYFPSVPVVSAPYAEYVQQAPELIARALTDSPIAVFRGHGVYAWGENLNRAYKWTCSLELSAQTALLAKQAGTL